MIYTWPITMTARSSITHVGDTRGTVSLLRRETILQPDGRLLAVPVISGNSWRGRLRRIGEDQLRDAVDYAGHLTPAAAHALRGGGALAKTGREPLSGSRLQQLRALVPHIGIFGAAAGGTIIDGCLDVGKLLPHVTETAHLTGDTTGLSMFRLTQLEAYTRQSDATSHDFAPMLETSAQLNLDPATGIPDPTTGANQMLFYVETMPAGTRLSGWLRLRHPADLELAYFVDVLDAFTTDGRLGGRAGIGHGDVDLTINTPPRLPELPDWRSWCHDHRAEILDILSDLA